MTNAAKFWAASETQDIYELTPAELALAEEGRFFQVLESVSAHAFDPRTTPLVTFEREFYLLEDDGTDEGAIVESYTKIFRGVHDSAEEARACAAEADDLIRTHAAGRV